MRLFFGLLALGLVLIALDKFDRGDAPILIAGAAQMPKVVTVPDPAAPPAVALYSDANPPQRYRGNASFKIVFMDDGRIGAECGDHRFAACELGGIVIISNPCLELDQIYAHRLCHELGHVNGWPRMHGG